MTSRRLLTCAAAFVVALAVLATVPARADGPIGPVQPITVPGSVVGGSLDNATAAERARAVGNVMGGAESKPLVSARSALMKGGTRLFAPAGAFMLGFEAGNAILRWVGVPEEYIGLDNLLDELFPRAPEYVPDVDFTPLVITANPSSQVNMTGVHLAADASGATWLYLPNEPKYGPNTFGVAICWYNKPAGYLGNACGASTLGGEWYQLPAAGFRIKIHQGAAGDPAAPFPGSSGSTPSLRIWDYDYTSLGNASSITAASTGTPQRYLETRWTCGGTPSTAATSNFFETDTEYPSPKAATCPGGQLPSGVSIWHRTVGDPSKDTALTSWTTPTVVQDWFEDRPDCVGENFGSCRLMLYRVVPGVDLDCFTSPEACVNWFEVAEPGRSEQFRCEYGGLAVALAECFVYRPTFNVAAGQAVDTGTQKHPVTTILPVADPLTGELVPGEGAMPVTAPAGPGDCPPPFNLQSVLTGYWVFKGTQCALAWAFIPPANPLTQWGDTISAAVPKMPDLDVTSTGACGIPLTIPPQFGGGFTFNLVPICPGEAGHGAAGVLRVANIAVVGLLFTVSTVGTVTWALGWSNPLARLTWFANGERSRP